MVDSKEPVPPGHIASVITHLEMHARPAPIAKRDARLRLEHWQDVSRQRYSDLFRRVGAPWLWFSRLTMPDAALQAILTDPKIMLHAIRDDRGSLCGILELDFRISPACEIVYLGLTPDYTGQGHGEWLMSETLRLAWRDNITRVWLRTCTLDHPAALGFYRKHGFVPFKQEVEIYPDPRLTGHLPRDAAPQIPIITQQ